MNAGLRCLKVEPLVRALFAPFGQVLDFGPGDSVRRNFAALLFNGRAGANPNLRVQRTDPTPLPLLATAIERHRHSSQLFAPLSGGPYLVVVFPSATDGSPIFSQARAFAAGGDQAINYNRDTWHLGFRALWRPGTFLMLRWEDGTEGDEEFLSLPWPIQIES